MPYWTCPNSWWYKVPGGKWIWVKQRNPNAALLFGPCARFTWTKCPVPFWERPSTIHARGVVVNCIGALSQTTSAFFRMPPSEHFRNCRKKCFVRSLCTATNLLLEQNGAALFGNAPWRAVRKLNKGLCLRRACGSCRRIRAGQQAGKATRGWTGWLPDPTAHYLPPRITPRRMCMRIAASAWKHMLPLT
jgi:hypothetical protein